MAKYVKSNNGCVVVDPSPYVAAQCDPVIVLPEADWRRLVELIGEFQRDGYAAKWDGTEIDEIIQRTEEASNA